MPNQTTLFVRLSVLSVLAGAILGMVSLPAMALEAEQPIKPELLQYKMTENAKGEAVKLHLHIFKPEGWSADDKRPAIVFFFGGGWTGGQPQHFYEHSKELASQGMVAISAEYRIKGKHGTTPLACVEDGKSAVRFVRQNAQSLGVDPHRIAAGGGSAGGHVAACTGVLKGFDRESEDASVSSVPNLMILFNPVIDTSPENGYGSTKVPGNDPLIISPLHHVHEDQPPSLILHGDADTTTPIGSIRAFAKRSKQLDVASILVEYKGAKHGFFNHPSFRKPPAGAPDYYRMTMDEVLDFLASYGYVDQEDNS